MNIVYDRNINCKNTVTVNLKIHKQNPHNFDRTQKQKMYALRSVCSTMPSSEEDVPKEDNKKRVLIDEG